MEEIKKHILSAPGKYYVDLNVCIWHEFCLLEAPKNFKADENNEIYVFKQPSSFEEVKNCEDAMMTCPVEAIHNDG